ncbi:Signal transduction histidine kinase [Chryseobacterium rhizoplanae]|uniref:histidine kinase n=1 Tax=Chryseobacterium rhizoplanae TaxID=1609531 RepID=A0A521EHN1_9FLAO|nr:ATP-binding protein [Chryseobacterium rhizoplanae]SMO83423.1 Signal transduction histidine kinase [Chryseobacterium rhizoplanae]
MINKYLLLLLFTLGSQYVSAQGSYFYYLEKKNSNFDSLVAAANHETIDTIKAIKSYQICATYFTRQDLDNYNKYLKQGLESSSKSQIYKDIGLYYQALIHFTKPDFAALLEKDFVTAESALKKYRSTEAKRIRIIMFQNLSLLKVMQTKETEAMNLIINKAVPIAISIGDNELIGGLYKNVALLFYNSHDFSKAIEYCNLAELFLSKLKKQTPQSNGIMGEVLLLKAECLMRKDKLPEAKIELNKTYSIIKNYPESNFNSLYLSNLGYYQMKQKNYPEALKTFDLGLQNAEKYKNTNITERIKLFKHQIYQELKNFKQSNNILKEVYQKTSYKRTKQEVMREFFKNYTALKDTVKANLYATEYINSLDSINNISIHKNIALLEAKYRKAEDEKKIAWLYTEKAKKQMEVSKKNSYLWLLSLALLSFIGLLIFLYIIYRKNKKLSEQKEINLQQKIEDIKQKEELSLTKAILDGEERERERIARDLHDGLGGMLAGVKINFSVWSSSHLNPEKDQEFYKILGQLDNSVSELRHVARNLMPESLLNFGLETALHDLCEFYNRKNLEIDFQAIDIDKALPLNIQLNIYRIVQELLANAIKHAEASSILLQCSQSGESFLITIEDNGKGFDKNIEKTTKSMGLRNLKNRVNYLKGKMEINSDHQGTIINIELNIHGE